MNIENIFPFSRNNINVIIETPKGSRNKYAYDPELKIIRFKNVLTEGHIFPYDFGFIPGTKGEDGDPLDVLVIMPAAAFAGCLVECRVIGAITAMETGEEGKIRNDRILAVPMECEVYSGIKSITDLNKIMLEQIIHFFISYNEMKGKKFKPLKNLDAKMAIALIKKSIIEN